MKEWVFIILRLILAVIFFILFVASTIPAAIGIYNIGVFVSIGGFSVAFLITVFWEYFCILIKKAYSITFLKWALSLIFAFLGLMLLGAIIISVMMLCSMSNASAEPNQTVIVLGCQVRGETPTRMLAGRLNKAYEYLSENSDSLCIVSGGQGNNEGITEAEAMKRYLVDKGIDPQRIIEEGQSTNTYENLLYSKQIMEEMELEAKAIIVTDGFHEWRAQYIAKQVGIDATGLGSEPYWPLQICFWVREIFGVVRVILLGY